MSNSKTQPVLIIVMGVSGCGKSTLAKRLAKVFGYTFLEADDFHSAENKAHMASGKPLTDPMREPWIASMCTQLSEFHLQGDSSVLAYSGLRRSHREKFRSLGYPTLFLHLAGPKELIHRRMKARAGHFMPSELLDSQYKALESTESEPDIIEISLAQSIRDIIEEAKGYVNQHSLGALTPK